MSRVVWICDGCGKVSGAKRRPDLHRRWEDVFEDGEKTGRLQRWCGRFVRHVAEQEDPKLSPEHGRDVIGTPTGRTFEFYTDPNEGIEVPF